MESPTWRDGEGKRTRIQNNGCQQQGPHRIVFCRGNFIQSATGLGPLPITIGSPLHRVEGSSNRTKPEGNNNQAALDSSILITLSTKAIKIAAIKQLPISSISITVSMKAIERSTRAKTTMFPALVSRKWATSTSLTTKTKPIVQPLQIRIQIVLCCVHLIEIYLDKIYLGIKAKAIIMIQIVKIRIQSVLCHVYQIRINHRK